MQLNHIVLRNFRNYIDCEVNFPKPVNLIIGGNAQGKTSLLEAIYFLCTAESHRAYPDTELIRHNEAGFYLKGVLTGTDNDLMCLEAAKSARGMCRLKKNSVLQSKRSEWIGQFKVVFFSPESLTLVKGAPAIRRRFLDLLIAQIDSTYLTHSQRYRFVLKQRNELLKQIRAAATDAGQLGVWDKLLVEHGTAIIFKRLAVFRQLKSHALQKHLALTGGRETLEVTYCPAWTPNAGKYPRPANAEKQIGSNARTLGGTQGCIERFPNRATLKSTPKPQNGATFDIDKDWHPQEVASNFATALKGSREADVRRGTTSVGPHRDDFHLELETGFDAPQGRTIIREAARAYGSQGQHRTIALALKLAELELIRETTGRAPIVLLDDVISELDYKRTAYLLDVIQNLSAQTFITSTHQELLLLHLDEPSVLIVENGQVVA